MFGIDDLGAAIGGLAGAGASIFGTSAQNSANQQNAQSQFMYNLMLQQQQQAYNTQMANTQYQRTTSDMRAAGLNPILAAGGFSPDSASSGQGSVSQARSENVAQGAVSSAFQLGKMLAELKQIDTHIQRGQAETETEKRRPALLEAQTSATGQETAHRAAGTALTGEQIKSQEMRNRDYQRGGEGTVSFSMKGLGNVSVPISAIQRFGIDGVTKMLGGEMPSSSPKSPGSSAKEQTIHVPVGERPSWMGEAEYRARKELKRRLERGDAYR